MQLIHSPVADFVELSVENEDLVAGLLQQLHVQPCAYAQEVKVYGMKVGVSEEIIIKICVRRSACREKGQGWYTKLRRKLE